MNKSNRMFAIDWFLVVPTVYLLGIGTVVLQSLASAGNTDVNMATQGIAIGIGLVVLLVMRSTSLEAFSRISPYVYGVSVLLLLVVLFAGSTAQGAERWIQVGGVQFQPSEVAKLGLILIVARLLALRREAVNSPLSFIVVLVYALIPALLVVLQPDLGTAITIFLIWIAMLAVSRFRGKSLVLLLIVISLSGIAMTPLLASYQQERITSFLRPSDDPLGSNYNVLQSEIAVGSGGLFGKGLEAGSQSQYNFLPSAHTDFVFAVTAEKLGIVGALSILVACMLIVLRGLMIAWSSKSEFGRYASVGIVVVLLMQSIVNIGMNIGVLPVTGLPLPLMSFGGTHIIVELAMIGFLLAVNRQTKT